MKQYVLIIEKGSDAYWGYLPDVPGCTVGGSSVDEVLRIAPDVLASHLDGEECPDAREIAVVLGDRDVQGLLSGNEIFATVAYAEQLTPA